MSRPLFDKRLILVTGKGGVGRSTLAASIASACAKRGRKTLLFEANANDRFGSFFGAEAVGHEIKPLARDLYAVNTTPAAALEEYGLMILRFKRVYRMVFENRVTKYFLRAIPGLDDYAILGKAWYHTTEGKREPTWDTVVFDMPASGHTLSMLRTPRVILDTVPEGPLTRTARAIHELLHDPERCAIVLVTLAEEMPTNEASDLAGALDDELALKVSRVLVNQVYPDRFPEGSPQDQVLDALRAHTGGGEATSDVTALTRHGSLARARRRLNEKYLQELDARFDDPVRLPYLFTPSIGSAEIVALTELLEDELG